MIRAIAILLLMAVPCMATDYWVYIRTSDRVGITKEDNAGRSKALDVVQILPVTAQNTPTKKEKSEWLILKISDFTQEQISKYSAPWISTSTVDGRIVSTPIAYRKYKARADLAGITVKPGVYATKITAPVIVNYLEKKTSADLTRYEVKRIYNSSFIPIVKMAQAIDDFFVPKAYAATTVISTINKSGEDYNTLTLWEDATDVNLVSADQVQVAEGYDDDGTLDENPVINGATVDSTRNRIIRSATGERLHLRPTSTLADGMIVDDDYCTIEGIEISNWSKNSDWSVGHGLQLGDGGRYTTVRNNIIHDSGNDSNDRQNGIYYSRTNYIYNNILYNISGTAIIEAANYGDDIIVCNNTIYNFNTKNDGSVGMYFGSDDTGNVKNNIVIAGATGGTCIVVGGMTASNNITSDTSGDIQSKTTTDVAFVSATNLHIGADSDAINVGVDLSALFTIDYDRDARPTGANTWDIGADEYVSAAPATTSGFIPYYRRFAQ